MLISAVSRRHSSFRTLLSILHSGTINSLTLTQIASTLSCLDRDHRVEATCNSKKRASLTNRNDCVAQVPREIRVPTTEYEACIGLWIELEPRERTIVSDFARFRRSVLRLLCQIRFVQIYTKRSRMCSRPRDRLASSGQKSREVPRTREQRMLALYIFQFLVSFLSIPLSSLSLLLVTYLFTFFAFFFLFFFYVFRDNSECMVPI